MRRNILAVGSDPQCPQQPNSCPKDLQTLFAYDALTNFGEVGTSGVAWDVVEVLHSEGVLLSLGRLSHMVSTPFTS